MAKKYTRAEWARIQSRFPEEDRVPWEESPDAPTQATVASVRAKEAADAAAAKAEAADTVDERTQLIAKGVIGNKPAITAEQAAQVSPSALAAQESGAIGAASIASQIAQLSDAETTGTTTPTFTQEELDQINAYLNNLAAQDAATAAALQESLKGLDILSNISAFPQIGPFDNLVPKIDGGDGGTGGTGDAGTGGTGTGSTGDGGTGVGGSDTGDGGGGGGEGGDDAGGEVYTFSADGLLLKNGGVYTGTYLGKNYKDGVEQKVAGGGGDDAGDGGGDTGGGGTDGKDTTVTTKTDPAITAALAALTEQLKLMQEQQKNVLTAEQIAKQARMSASQEFKDTLMSLGFTESDGVIAELDDMIRKDYTMAQIRLELPETKGYKQRFPGMETLRKAGRAINEATYISNEKGYLQTLRAYGLDTATLGSRTNLGVYIANEVSPREFEERVNLAATRVKENPDVMSAFKTFYPEADEGSVIAYLLNPKAGMDIIKKQVRISEIGAASTKAGFAKDLVNADIATGLMGAVGEAGYAQIVNEFSRARQFANAQRRLSAIENQPYSDLEAVKAVVGDDIQAGLASERRAAREVARFSGRGGVTGASLSKPVNI